MWLMLPPVRSLYLLWVMFSWLISYLCDIGLRFHPCGQLLFTDREKEFKNCTALSLGLTLVGFVLATITQEGLFFLVAILISLVSYWNYFSRFGEST
jgi:hypothetical protein